MNHTIVGIVAAVIVAGGGWYFYTHKAVVAPTYSDTGVYAYACDNGSQFSMTPTEDMSSIKLTPGVGASFVETTLMQKDSSAGARYEGGVLVFVGAGEGVALTVGQTTLNCNPQPSQEMAPFNWGDAGEGGGVKQDTSLIVTENMIGKWQSVDDAKFVREFKSGDAVTDWYENKSMSDGLWVAFTKEKAPKVFPYPMDDSSVYLQMTMTGTQADTLDFKITKVTPEELELIYLTRGGTLKFKRVQ